MIRPVYPIPSQVRCLQNLAATVGLKASLEHEFEVTHPAILQDANDAPEGMNICWPSAVNRRHSEEVAKDNHVAGSMCLPQAPGLIEPLGQMLAQKAGDLRLGDEVPGRF